MILKYIAKFLFWFHGWSFVGKAIPKEVNRCVLVFAPHTSNWDFYYGLLFMFSNGLPLKVAIKNSWTRFPFNLFINPLGGVGIDRSLKKKGEIISQVEIMALVFKRYEKIAFIITPEGTRAKRKRWKSGFYHIASRAEVPIVTITCNFPEKSIQFGPVFPQGESLDNIMQNMMVFFNKGVAKYPEHFALDERYV